MSSAFIEAEGQFQNLVLPINETIEWSLMKNKAWLE
jgi:hypothetical protein